MDNISIEEARHSTEDTDDNLKSHLVNEKESENIGSQMTEQASNVKTKLINKEKAKFGNDLETKTNITQTAEFSNESRKISTVEELEENECQSKSPTDDVDSPPASDDKPGRRKRKPSRFHDSMFDIPTNLMNINRTINPEEFRAFHSKSAKAKEKPKKLPPITEPEITEKTNVEQQDYPKQNVVSQPEPSLPSYDDDTNGDDVLDALNMFKFKMRRDHVIHSPIGGATLYRCDICMMTFPRSFSLRRHYTRRHVNPRYVLPKAGSINVTENENPEWISSLPLPQEDPNDSIESKYLYYCKMCSKDLMYFEHKDQLRNHCVEKHSSLPKRPVNIFKCEICKRSYSTKHELDRHKRTHSGERPYSCGFCGKTFPTSTNARRHERTHTGDKPYICKVCSRNFAQKSDMVKHLRSTHKMKVTKTKAERVDPVKKTRHEDESGSKSMAFYKMSSGESSKIRQSDEFKGIGNNEFQENIDFAAYLKLDQHDNGTLMGEKRQLRTALNANTNPENQQNNSNNHKPPTTSKDLKEAVPSELLIGVDGKPEKWHRCPNCSKMFTTNINLRRHHKLKHERNQLYQSAEPVSMVVEKYKIKNDIAVLSFEEAPTPPEKQPVDNIPVSKSEDTVVPIKDETASNIVSKIEDKPAKSSLIFSKKRIRGTNSRLSNIVQRLAHKRSAEQPVAVKQTETEEDTLSPPELQPIIKLEEMENQMFRDYFSSDSNSSPQRKRRKPNSVQHVETVPSFDEKLQSCITENQTPKSQPEKYYTRPLRQQLMEHTSGPSKIPELIRDNTNKFMHTVSNHEHRTQKPNFRNMYQQNQATIKRKHNFQGPNHRFISPKEYHHRLPMAPNHYAHTDISKSFAPLTSKPYPVQHRPEFRNDSPGNESEDPERIKTFLSQCWSSRRHDIPQNAILDKNMPVRDINAMNRKLKYNMRHMPSERINEHLPPSAYFSQRDPLSSGFNHMKKQKIFSPNFAKFSEAGPSKQQESTEKTQGAKNETQMMESDAEDHPLDLRIQSKKTVPDFVVRDDGVLDFSRKSKESFTKSKIPSPRSSSDRHIKAEYGEDFQSYGETSMMSPPYRNSSPGNRMDHPSDVVSPPMEMNSYQINEHRRAKLHGRSHSDNYRKPFKFHSINFETPRPRSPHPDYLMKGSRKPMPPPLKPFKEQSYRPQRLPPPNQYPIQRNSPNIPPNFQIPKQKMHLFHAQEHSHKQRDFNFPPEPPCSECHRGRIHSSHQHKPDYGRRNRLPMNIQQRQREKILHMSRTRPILPKPRDFNMKEQEQRHKPQIAYSDQDMMNRCIRKAQQALKVETLTGTDKSDNKEMVFKAGISKINSDKVIKNDDEAVSSLKGETSRTSNQQMSSSCGLPFNQKNYTSECTKVSAIGSPPPLFPDYNKNSTTESKTVLDGTELYAQDNTSHSQEMRHNLTMTPDLDCAQDDSAESDKISSVDENKSDEKVKPEENETHILELKNQVERTNKTSMTTVCETDKIDNLLNLSVSHKSPAVLKDSQQGPNITLKETSSTSQVEEKPHCSEKKIDGCNSSSILQTESFMTKSHKKIPHRRHTHFPNESESDCQFSDICMTNVKSLKRSLSNDSAQTPDSNDESDLSRKTIKKLKLRVIKSPGSEKKKCWTLVNQEQSNIQQGEEIQNQMIKPAEVAAQISEVVISTKDQQTEESATEVVDAKELPSKHAPKNDEQSETDGALKDGNEILKDMKQEVTKDSEEKKMKAAKVIVTTHIPEEKGSNETLLSTVTDEHIENVLSAVVIPMVDDIPQLCNSDDTLENETNIIKKCNEDNNDSEPPRESSGSNEAVQAIQGNEKETCNVDAIINPGLPNKSVSTSGKKAQQESIHKHGNHSKPKTKLLSYKHTENDQNEIKSNIGRRGKTSKTMDKKPIKLVTKKATSAIANDPNDNIFSRLCRVDLDEKVITQAARVDINISESTTNGVTIQPTADTDISEISDNKEKKNSTKTRSASTNVKSPVKKTANVKKHTVAAVLVNNNQSLRRSCRIRKSSSDKDKAAKKKK